MTEERFILLLQGFHDRQLSEEELLAFMQASDDPRFEAIIGERLHQELVLMKAQSITDHQRAGKVWEHVQASMKSAVPNSSRNQHLPAAAPPVHRIHFLKTAWLRYAAAVILLFGIAAYLWLSNGDEPYDQVVKADVAPGREGAILTLADGTRVLLDSLGDGMVAVQNGTQILLADGKLSYNAANADAVTYNTMRTPMGRQFSIHLPDGSKAWLNAASSITYPTAFIGPDRTVKISGEVYFEVAQDAKKPFKVEVNENSEVQVLGTSFNIKAYEDDASVNTTLIEGAVRLKAFQQFKTLKPGQQTQVRPDGTITLVNKADIAKIIAWKNGLFNFQDESFEEVMKQLERWYDIHVKYVGDPPKQKFFGELQRDLTLAQVIETLREIGIKFQIDGRTLIVTP